MAPRIAALPTFRGVAAALCLVACLGACDPRAANPPSPGAASGAGSADGPRPGGLLRAGPVAGSRRDFAPGGVIRYAARAASSDFFSIDEDEQAFFVASSRATGGAASKRAAEAFEELYRKSSEEQEICPLPAESKLSYVENRLVCGIKWANTTLNAASGRQRATAVAAVVNGSEISIAHVGKDRAYLIRDGQIRPLTRDHTVLEEYRQKHPDAQPSDLERLPRKHVLTRVLGPSGSVEVDLLTERALDGDRVLLAGEALPLALDDRAILDIVRSHGLEKVDLGAAAGKLAERAAASPGRPEVTVILLGFVRQAP
jgi:serine/threonine protein phosphatase PrpC